MIVALASMFPLCLTQPWWLLSQTSSFIQLSNDDDCFQTAGGYCTLQCVTVRNVVCMRLTLLLLFCTLSGSASYESTEEGMRTPWTPLPPPWPDILVGFHPVLLRRRKSNSVRHPQDTSTQPPRRIDLQARSTFPQEESLVCLPVWASPEGL